ncbi:thioredoxin family protein [Bacillus marinisedimentorum]|uniref:thioredoxin family protein n=1 Tax=Bacillus marinisedimentorum TaxID=1821260 RepID=UPI000872EB02|nr:thioredoxin family protein [Bacillus marinisedimentorum]
MKDAKQQDILQAINSGQTGAVYFYTPMCGTCKLAGKMLEVTEAMQPGLQILKGNLNIMPAIAEQWEIESVPCLLLYGAGGTEKMYAFHSVEHVNKKLKKHWMSRLRH